MATELLQEILQKTDILSLNEKRLLADHLQSGIERENGSIRVRRNGSHANAQKHLAWIKANREEYSGLYVALVGERLVGQGKSRREAVETAARNGEDDPFVVYVLSEHVIADGGL